MAVFAKNIPERTENSAKQGLICRSSLLFRLILLFFLLIIGAIRLSATELHLLLGHQYSLNQQWSDRLPHSGELHLRLTESWRFKGTTTPLWWPDWTLETGYRHFFATGEEGLLGLPLVAGPLWNIPLLKKKHGQLRAGLATGLIYLRARLADGETSRGPAWHNQLSFEYGLPLAPGELLFQITGRQIYDPGSNLWQTGLRMGYGLNF